jgi:hypothetical protein
MSNLVRLPQPNPRPATVTSALDVVLAFADAGIMAGRKDDFSTFERELHARMMGLERQILGEKLQSMDVDEGELLIDGVLHRRVLRSKQTYMTVAGEVGVERTLYRPRSDTSGGVVAALDKDVGIVDGFLTPEAAALALYVVTELTPNSAEALLKRVGNMTPSKSTLGRLAKHVSTTWEENREAFEEGLRAATTIPQGACSVAVSLDGVMAPMVDGEGVEKREKLAEEGRLTRGSAGYREVGCGTLSFCDANGDVMNAIRFARAPEAHKATLKEMLAAELRVIRDLRPDLAIVKLADGVDDNWTFLAGQLKEGVEVADFWHAAEHINAALGAAYGDGTKDARKRFVELRHVLLDEDDGAEKVIRSLEYLHKKYARRDSIRRALGYFRRHRHRMSYAAMKRRGLPIGSGVVEAACKTLVTQRLKRSGMRWSDDGAQAILTPRGWVQSDRYDLAWALVASTWHACVTTVGQVVPLHSAR